MECIFVLLKNFVWFYVFFVFKIKVLKSVLKIRVKIVKIIIKVMV